MNLPSGLFSKIEGGIQLAFFYQIKKKFFGDFSILKKKNIKNVSLPPFFRKKSAKIKGPCLSYSKIFSKNIQRKKKRKVKDPYLCFLEKIKQKIMWSPLCFSKKVLFGQNFRFLKKQRGDHMITPKKYPKTKGGFT